MELSQAQPPTTLSHGEPPYPVGTLVEDTASGRTGELRGVIEERLAQSGRVVRRTAYLRPRGGGVEWEVPASEVRPAVVNG
ncbi:hypothetical protein ACFV3R_03450 [Streptomyces sp. NPDC059740]|uniref:hypothetical protein n=1 Tax=Streptomyces sp. NPDC059740 TaxID=3346926 RepID=UPI00364D1316